MPELKQDLNLYGLTMIVIGTLIGSGIFLTPSQIAGHLSSPALILLAWGLGGLIALAGAFSFAELGSMFPRTGGVYVYLKEAYGPLVGFLFGWSSFTVVMTGIIAALAIACSNYLSFILPLNPFQKKIAGIVIIAALTLLNIIRVRVAGMVTNAFTILKLAGIATVIVAGFASKTSSLSESGLPTAVRDGSSHGLVVSLGLALIGVLWSFGGWQHVSYLSGEAKNPQRNIPLAIVIGVVAVVIVYTLTNISYMRLMSVPEMVASERIAADALSKITPFGGTLIAAIIVISVFGTTLIYILTTPRISYAMAKDGLFFRSIARVHPRHHTPANAIIVQGAWAAALLLIWGTFEAVMTYVVFIGWIFVMITVCALILFRIKRPDAPRPYKAFGYPVTPVVFIAAIFLFVINTLIHNWAIAGAGLALQIVGLPFYFYFQRRRRTSGIPSQSEETDSQEVPAIADYPLEEEDIPA